MDLFENLIHEIFQNKDSQIAKDLKLNFKKYLTGASLHEKSVMLIAYSLAGSFKITSLERYAHERLVALNFSPVQIQEAHELAAFTKMLNTYYKFKNFIGNNEDYNVAGLRMNAMGKPSLSKAEFETLALAHSLANSCEFCVKAHEKELRAHDLSADNIHDIARLTSVLAAVQQLSH